MNNELLLLVLKELTKTNETIEPSQEVSNFWATGKKYFIRTVTMHVTGELVSICDKEIHLKTAAWIADSGRFHEALKTGSFDEVEPFVEDIIVNRGAIVDATIWTHDLPVLCK